MCDIPVNLPTLASFLMLYSLRCGSIVVFFWTFFRSLVFLAFFMWAVLLMYMPESERRDSQPSDNNFCFVFVPYLVMIVTEAFVFIGVILLGRGLFCENAFRVGDYLVCRFCALVFETLGLVCLCFHHYYYIGWYLMFLMIIILEFYAFIVVYSYYVDMAFEEKEWERGEMGDAYKNRDDICVNYASLPERREPSVSGVSQDTRDIETSQTTRDTTDTPNTRTTRDMSTTSVTRKPKDKQKRGKRHMRELRRLMCFK